MIGEDWPRVAGVFFADDGSIACVWLAYERDTDMVHLYDAAKLDREVLAVVGEALNARGRFIPVAWCGANKEFAKDLLDRGCNTIHDAADDGDAMAEVITRTIWERMRSARFKVDRRLTEWLEEFQKFQRTNDGKVPRAGAPLMTATRLALQMLDRGRSTQASRTRKNLYPALTVV
jgi:hypothetical protein